MVFFVFLNILHSCFIQTIFSLIIFEGINDNFLKILFMYITFIFPVTFFSVYFGVYFLY